MDARALDRRLVRWASEYGGGRYADLGYSSTNILARVVEMGGFVPTATGKASCAERTPADEIEAIVRGMETVWMASEAAVLRCDYFRPGISIEHRLSLLRSAGCAIGKSTYYRQLETAREYVALKLAEKGVK